MVMVARHAEKLQLYLAFARSTTPTHGKEKVAFPIDGIGAGSGFTKKDRYTDIPRCR